MYGLKVLSILSITAILSASTAAAQDAPQPPVIVTTGAASVRRAPDVAYVVVAIETRASSPRDAQRQNATVATAVVNRLTELGIPKDAVKTLGLQLNQEFDMPGGRRVPRGYAARNAMEVRIDDIVKAGEIADAAVTAGATSIDGIRFDLKDRGGAEREAIRLAVVDARGRAEAAAAGAGRTIDRILKIEEHSAHVPRPIPMMTTMRAEVAQTPVEAGLIEIRSEVTLTVAMR